MQPTGIVLRDLDGYEWHNNVMRAKNHDAFEKWYVKYGADEWAVMPVSKLFGAVLPPRFEVYDPFQKETALFEIASRLSLNFSRDAVLDFANRWGLIDPQGISIFAWENCLTEVHLIAKAVGKSSVKAHQARTADAIGVNLSKVNVRYQVVIAAAGGLQSKMVVPGLRGCLLIQAAEAVVNQLAIRNCDYCGKPMSPSEIREDCRFCSDSCRIQTSKRRKKQAIELHAKGKSAAQMAAAVNSDIKIVRKWLKPKGK
jgi:predicted nucleic acid-binding Zn ribbon protein